MGTLSQLSLLNREQVQAHVRAYMERDYPATRLREIAAARAAWGYLPRGYDLQAAHLRLFDGGVAAFYDARAKVIVVPARCKRSIRSFGR